VGGGGREHALCWALKRDAPDATVFAAPGNPGTAQLGTNLSIDAGEVGKVVEAVKELRIDLTVVGPDAPLAAGLADALPAPALPAPCSPRARSGRRGGRSWWSSSSRGRSCRSWHSPTASVFSCCRRRRTTSG